MGPGRPLRHLGIDSPWSEVADLADVLAVMAQGDLEGEPRTLLQQALAAEPTHIKSLLLLAATELRQGRLDEARRHWESLLAVSPPIRRLPTLPAAAWRASV